METSELITRLSEDLEPIKPPLSLSVRILGWVVSMMLFSVVAVVVAGTRADIHSALSSPRFVVESLAIFLAGLSAGVLALILSAPGKRTRHWSITAAGAAFIWIVSVGTALFFQMTDTPLSEGFMLAGMVCSQHIIALAVVPSFLLTALLRMGSPIAGKSAGAFVLIAAGLLGAFALQFSCPKDHSVHLMIYHILPVVALGALGWSIGTYLCGFETALKQKRKHILDNKG